MTPLRYKQLLKCRCDVDSCSLRCYLSIQDLVHSVEAASGSQLGSLETLVVDEDRVKLLSQSVEVSRLHGRRCLYVVDVLHAEHTQSHHLCEACHDGRATPNEHLLTYDTWPAPPLSPSELVSVGSDRPIPAADVWRRS